MAAGMAVERKVRRFTVQQVFNLPLSEGHLVVDVRPREAYATAHLVSAWWWADGGGDAASGWAELMVQVWDEDPPDQTGTLLICTEPGQNVDSVVEMLTILTAEACPGGSASPFGRLLGRLRTVGLFDGVGAFAEQFPFFTVAGDTRYTAGAGWTPSLPALIFPAGAWRDGRPRGALYLGSQTHASSEDAFGLLGIRAVVNATIEVPSHFEDGANGISYHRCRIRDDDNQRLAEAFMTSLAFLDETGCGAGTATLVHCSRGRNRSAAMVAHYLVRRLGFVPDEAVETVRLCRGSMTLDNRNFEEQILGLADQ